MRSEALKTARIEARIRPDDKALLEEAAGHLGLSLADFVTTSARVQAEEVMRRRDEVALSRQDQEAFVQALLNPPQPNDKLKAAVARYGSAVER